MIKAVVFDLDGTITKPFLNFQEIRLEIGVSQGRESLLDQIESMGEDERQRALEVLARHEEAAAKNAELNRGVRELLDYIAARGLAAAVVTRNSDKSTRRVLDMLDVRVERVSTRDSDLAVKPDPESLFYLAEEWGIEPTEILMVGDHPYDIQYGRAVDAVTCLVTNGRDHDRTCMPDHQVEVPGDVIEILESLIGR